MSEENNGDSVLDDKIFEEAIKYIVAGVKAASTSTLKDGTRI